MIQAELGQFMSRERFLIFSPLSCPGLTGASSTPQLFDSSRGVSGIQDRPVPPTPRLRRGNELARHAEALAKAASRAMTPSGKATTA